MGFIAGLIGLLLLVIIIALFLFAAIFMARKIGLLKTPEIIDGADEGENPHSGKHYVKRYVSDLKVISDSLVFRFILIAVLIGFMMIPLGLVSDVVRERSNLYRGVLNEISSTWGQQQNLQGPALFVPYTEKFITEEVKTDKDGYERKVNKTIYKQRTAIVLPDDLNILVNLNGETRKRSLYESLVYTADLNVTGDFQRPDISSLSNNIDEIHWSRSWLALGISDTQAINKVSGLNWNSKKPIDFEPGTKVVNTIASGFHAPLDLTQLGSNDNGAKIKYPFQLTLNVNGSQGFYFTPFGKTTEVEIVSDWPHPSFQGSVLPNKHEVNSDGFEATWSVPNLARNYPQLWTLEKQKFNVNEFQAGVNLFESVSLYSQITRAIKYGLLFFTLTYITFLIFEMGIGRRLHIVQYGVIGLALSMFYLTLLSMAEHAGFFNAYISAAGIIILMISLYAYAAIRSFKRTIIVSILLAGLYTLLYSLLKLEDYALLAGTVLLLVILAVLMVLTRNIGREVDKGSDNNPDDGEKNNIINSGDNRGGDSKKSDDVISTSNTNIVAT